jgi:hypothetical protein
MRLALKLLQEKLKSETPSGSYFGNYLSSLPASQPLPIYYAEDIPEIQVFVSFYYSFYLIRNYKSTNTDALKYMWQFANVEQEAVAAITELLRVTQKCLSVQDTHADPFKGAFTDVGPLLWATAAASSRAFRVGGGGGRRQKSRFFPSSTSSTTHSMQTAFCIFSTPPRAQWP